MRTRHINILNLLFVIGVLLLFTSCGGGSGSQSAGGKGSITAKVAMKSTSAGTAATLLPGVVTVRLSVSGSGMTTTSKDFPVTDGKGTINDVPAGSSRTLTVQGLDSSQSVIYEGTATNITVQEGQTTDVGTVAMFIKAITATSMEGSWKFTEPSNSSWSMLCTLYSGGTGSCSQNGASPFAQNWSYNQSTSYFTMGGTNTGSVAGTVSGNSADFYINGVWSNGTAANFHVISAAAAQQTLSADQAAYESFVMSSGGSYSFYWNLPPTGTPVSGANYLAESHASLTVSPANGTQKIYNTALSSLGDLLSVPAVASTPTRYLINGAIVVGSDPASIVNISYQGTSVRADHLAADGVTTVQSRLRTNFSVVPLSGTVVSAPTDLAHWFGGALYYNQTLLGPSTTWGVGAAYLKFTETIIGDVYEVFDNSSTPTTVGNTPLPYATNSTISAVMASASGGFNSTSDATTYTMANGTVAVINGVKTYVATNPRPNQVTTQYRTYYEINGNVYTGSLIKSGTVRGGSVYQVAAPGTTLGYTNNYSSNYQIRLNKAAVDSLRSAVTFQTGGASTTTTTTKATTTTTTAATTTTVPGVTTTTSGTSITGNDLTGIWDIIIDIYADTTGNCKVSPTVTSRMVCAYTYGANCTYTSTCTTTANGITLPPQTSSGGTTCSNPNTAVNTTPPADACNTQYNIVQSGNPLSMSITGTINGAKYIVMTQTKR